MVRRSLYWEVAQMEVREATDPFQDNVVMLTVQARPEVHKSPWYACFRNNIPIQRRIDVVIQEHYFRNTSQWERIFTCTSPPSAASVVTPV